MAYGKAPKPPDGAVMAPPGNLFVPSDQAAKVSRVGPLMLFLPAIFDRMTVMACRMSGQIASNLLNGNFEVLDAETTGFSRSKCAIWQLSAMRFKNFEPAEALDKVISITREEYDQAFAGQDNRDEIMQRIHLTWDRIEKEGVPAKGVLDDFDNFLRGNDDIPLLGYHTRSIDLPFIQLLCAEHYPGREVFLPMSRLIDVGVAVKSAQNDQHMQATETCDDFMKRVNAARSKQIYWSVAYVTEQFNLGLDQDELHDALTDCKVLGMIWEFIAHQGMTNERKLQWQDLLLGKIQSD